MPLSWNEIKNRTVAFVNEWKNETSEKAEAQTFQNEFLNIFGISRRRVASFEKKVKKADDGTGFIDLFWKGMLLIEMKSTGKDLKGAFKQATDYFHGLKEHELPKYVLVCDFKQFRLYDLEGGQEHEFSLEKLLDHINLFGFIAGYQKRSFADEDPVNIKAAERMGKLHDRLEKIGYTGHELEVYLVRILFCLFAEDTSIFERGIFQEYLLLHTKEDGSDLAMHLANLFQVLNTPKEKRLKNLDENLGQFPYVNGHLFKERLPFAAFDAEMRETILGCCTLDWSQISPAIFGSMFQAAMNPKERRNLGAHYTSEKNIQKLIGPLFLDDLKQELQNARGNSKKLQALHKKLAELKFLDPACGCGNFLIITYRELRLLELEVLKELYGRQQAFGIDQIVQVDVDQFYGIEYDEFPARIAEVALWLMDHQMNLRVSEAFGEYFVRLPLKKSATIVHGNALRIPWESVVSKTELNYILGNPPFYGKQYQSKEQKEDMKMVFDSVKGAGVLDYVSGWYLIASKYIHYTQIKVAFVSTNSISQGEQTGILWSELFNKYGIKIHFAHRTFKWNNEAKGNAAVHVVIIGFASYDTNRKRLFEYEDIKGEPQEISPKNINPYLIEGPNITFQKLSKPICNILPMNYGSMPNDGGHLILDNDEKRTLVQEEPLSKKYIRRFVMGKELIRNIPRYCLWLLNCTPQEIKRMPKVLARMEKVKQQRASSRRPKTRELSKYPMLFGEIRQPNSDFIALPRVSSERRKYIPITILANDIIAGDKVYTISTSDLFLFGNLLSEMHMCWMRYTCGRMKSDYSYSNSMVYNNYPFPKNVSKTNKKKVETAAQKVLEVRENYPNSSLADLYDPLTMPPPLVKAHQALDKAVDRCYRPQPFTNERNRIEFLFELYEQYTAPLLNQKTKNKKK